MLQFLVFFPDKRTINPTYLLTRAVSRLDFPEIRESRFDRESIFPRSENREFDRESIFPRSENRDREKVPRTETENREFFIYLFQVVKFYFSMTSKL